MEQKSRSQIEMHAKLNDPRAAVYRSDWFGPLWKEKLSFRLDLLQVDLLVSGASIVWPRTGRP